MSTLGKAIIQFAADTVGFRGDVGRAVHIFESGVGRMQKAFGGWKSQLAGGISVASIVLFGKHVLESADQLAKLSDKTGRTVEDLSALKLGYELGGGAADGFARGMRELNKSIVEATNSGSQSGRVFAAMGVDISKGQKQVLRDFADSFAQLPQDLRVSVAEAVLGKAGEGWIPVLAKGSKGLDEAAEKARKLGLIVSTDFARQSEEFLDNVKLLEKGAVSLGNVVLSKAAPAFSHWADRMVQAAEKGRQFREVWETIKDIGAFVGPEEIPANARLRRERIDRATGGGETLVEAMVQGRVASGKIKQPPPSERSLTASLFPSAPDPKKVRDALANTEALQKRQAAALQQMEERKRALFDLDERELMLIRIKGGSYKDFDASTKKRLMDLAKEIDLRAQHIRRIELETAAHLVQAAALERGAELFADYVQAGRLNADEMAHSIRLVGATTREQEKLNALRELEVELLARKRQAAAVYGEDVAGLMVEVARLDQEAARQRKAAIDGIDERQRLERHWLTGARLGLLEYADAATNAAANVRQAFSSTFGELEGELTDFVRRGKFDLASLVDFAADEAVRGGIRQFVTGPLAEGLAGILGDGAGAGGIAVLSAQATTTAGSLVALDASLLNTTATTVGLDAAFISTTGTTLALDAALLNAAAAAAAFAASASAGTAASAAAFAFEDGGIMTSRGRLPLNAYAGGGIARGPQLALFGEGRMPEAYVPLPDGKRIPVALEGGVAGGGRGGPNVFIDARGADREGMARLEALVAQMNGSIEQRAVAAVFDRNQRGGKFRRGMRS